MTQDDYYIKVTPAQFRAFGRVVAASTAPAPAPAPAPAADPPAARRAFDMMAELKARMTPAPAPTGTTVFTSGDGARLRNPGVASSETAPASADDHEAALSAESRRMLQEGIAAAKAGRIIPVPADVTATAPAPCETCEGRSWIVVDASTANELVQDVIDCPDCAPCNPVKPPCATCGGEGYVCCKDHPCPACTPGAKP